ncbi:flagellar motor switch protein FliN [bacterium]|nr:flagellar motor switch protein FliN [bacterium]
MEQENNLDTETQETEVVETESSETNSVDTDKIEAPEPEAFESSDNSLGAKPQQVMPSEGAGMELLMDVNLEMTVELGRARLSISEVMDLTQGSVIELDKMAGEPVDIRVNGVLLAQGEVIVMDDIFGVRITRLNQRVDHTQLLR